MYNGIGLSTPRGSGTSGHVTRNAATVRQKPDYAEMRRKEDASRVKAALPTDPGIAAHEHKRKVELRVQEWVRAEKIRARYDKETAARLIREKRKELEEREEGQLDERKTDDNESRGKKRSKEERDEREERERDTKK